MQAGGEAEAVLGAVPADGLVQGAGRQGGGQLQLEAGVEVLHCPVDGVFQAVAGRTVEQSPECLRGGELLQGDV